MSDFEIEDGIPAEDLEKIESLVDAVETLLNFHETKPTVAALALSRLLAKAIMFGTVECNQSKSWLSKLAKEHGKLVAALGGEMFDAVRQQQLSIYKEKLN